MVGVGEAEIGLPQVEGYPNYLDKQSFSVLAVIAGMNLFMVLVFWLILNVKALPIIVFVLGTTIVYSYYFYKDRYLLAPIRVAVESIGLRFIYRSAREERIGWERIAGMNSNFGGRPGAAAVILVDRLGPVKVPAEVIEAAKYLLEEDETAALARSSPQHQDPRTKQAKVALRDKTMGRKLIILMALAMPVVTVLSVIMVLY